MKTRTIRQSVTFKAMPHDVYEALMDSRKHAKFSGEKASMSRKVGGKFMYYGGYIEGDDGVIRPAAKADLENIRAACFEFLKVQSAVFH